MKKRKSLNLEDEFIVKLRNLKDNGELLLYRNTDNVISEVFCVLNEDIVNFTVYYMDNITDADISKAQMVVANFRNVIFMWTEDNSSYEILLDFLSNSFFDVLAIDSAQSSIKQKLVKVL